MGAGSHGNEAGVLLRRHAPGQALPTRSLLHLPHAQVPLLHHQHHDAGSVRHQHLAGAVLVTTRQWREGIAWHHRAPVVLRVSADHHGEHAANVRLHARHE